MWREMDLVSRSPSLPNRRHRQLMQKLVVWHVARPRPFCSGVPLEGVPNNGGWRNLTAIMVLIALAVSTAGTHLREHSTSSRATAIESAALALAVLPNDP